MQKNGLAGNRLVAEPQWRLKLATVPVKCTCLPAPFIFLPAGLEVTHRQKRHGRLEMRLGKFRRGRDRSFEVGQGFDGPIEPTKRVTSIGQDLRMSRHRRKTCVVARNRFDRPVESQKRVAPVDESADVAGFPRQHAIVTRKRLGIASERKKGIAEIVEDLRMTRRKAQRVTIARDRLVMTSGGLEREPEI